ncbi:MAG: LamG domain-containing protein, partial [Prevotellaceae bacterium]|nr:LamG domain-containing protein [Prevotellaceae bacterium]
ATLKGSARAETLGEYTVVSLGSASGYVDLGSQAGSDFAALGSFSVSCYYRVDDGTSLSGNGFFLWSYSTSQDCGSSSGTYHAYRLNEQRIATSRAGYTGETGYSVGSASQTGRWVHVCYTQSGNSGRLYIDGTRVASISGMPLPSSAFTTTPSYCWLGRSPFSSDSYLPATLVYGFTLYDEALTADEVARLSQETESLDYAYTYGNPGDFTKLSEAVEQADAFLASVTEGTYPQAALDDYEDVLGYCRQMVAQGLVSQTLIDDALSKLSAAKASLEASKGFTFGDASAQGYDTARGFRHPGGLHTEADFERIRQQLSEGDATVTSAYSTLCNAEYAQSTAATYPVETIIRGGGTGENYINAARGATIAYQNALRWRISGNEAFAKHAVEVLMAWANTTTGIGGDSNYALASGIYGYEFANAAELVRDYEGWAEEDFNAFKQWMLNLWYPTALRFLRVRNGTWENSSMWWQCPGHYWSNWGLSNALCVASIGVLCDDVYIYNQGMSFFKYDQVGTFVDPRTADPILNDGLTEFLGNLVVTTTESDFETGAYGKLGQMQESGRDIGHATMAAGLAVDFAHLGWNQGDDLFSYMDNRLAAGIEYVAGQVESLEGLPWTNYHYASNGYYWTDSRSWLMTEPALGEQIRPYWGTVIGHYEGVKGVTMPLSETVYKKMGIDAGGTGSTSGSYDHLGYSVLMNTRSGIAAPEDVPTTLTPYITYDGETLEQSNLGGLYNPYWDNGTTAVETGQSLTLWAELPEGETNTGKWQWSTGETTQSITVSSDKSYAYRVTYTNENGAESEQLFTIAAKGDCEELSVTPYYNVGDGAVYDTDITLQYGSSVTLGIAGGGEWNSFEWENGQTGSELTLTAVTHDREVKGALINHGGRRTVVCFHITVSAISPVVLVDGVETDGEASVIVNEGADVTLKAVAADLLAGGTYLWDDGSEGETLELGVLTESVSHTVTYTLGGTSYSLSFELLVTPSEERLLDLGNYTIQQRSDGMYMTNQGLGSTPSFLPLDEENPETQQWYLYRSSEKNPYYELRSLVDSTSLNASGEMVKRLYTRPYTISFASGTDYAAIYTRPSTKTKQFIYVEKDGSINFDYSDTLYGYPFLVEWAGDGTMVSAPRAAAPQEGETKWHDLAGRPVSRPSHGVYIKGRKKVVVKP